MASLAATFGRGAMTNHWKDIKNADVVLVMGANPAENHPCGFKWALEARDENNATLVTIDPRFTRTSAVADKHLQIRPGADIAVLGGLIRHLLTNDLHHADYVRAHTNASFLVSGEFGFEDGLFSGFDEAASAYDKTSWSYQRGSDGLVRRDLTLEDPRCVFQLLKQHYERYTPSMVAQISGCSEEKFLEMADIICSTGRADRVGTIMYAVGWTMHTVGSQIIRTGAMLQLLLGNIGRPGGGINALRGHANVQGATDHAIVAGILPGYLKVPTPEQATLADHLEASTPQPLVADTVNYWGNYPKFLVSQLKAWFGDSATAANEYGYQYLGKQDGDATWLSIWDQARQGSLEGFVSLGFNPLLAGPDVPRLIESMTRLKWKVVIDPFMLDSAEFWRAPGVNPAEVDTEVLYLPTTHWIERDGSFTNSGRWAQWKEKAIDPPNGVRSDTYVLSELFWRVKELYQQDGDDAVYNEPIQNLTWNYLNPREPTLVELAKEINGYDRQTGELLSSFGQLTDDGNTSSGNWIYTGSYTEAGNMMARRETADPTGLGMHHGWAFSWPLNRRVLYNRASADAEGRPWDQNRAGIAWNGREWIGDVPDFGRTTPPDAAGAFIMTEEGVARLFSNHLADGPFSEHYEPVESPTANALHQSVSVNPVINWYDGVRETLATAGDDFPYACTVYRVVEHEHFVTRNVPLLVEAMPDFFVEVPEGLAVEKGIENGGRARVWSKRGEVEGVAIVTKRIKPLMVNGQTVWTIGIPVHWGFVGITQGSMANLLTPYVGDANTRCPEFKSFLVNIEPVALQTS
ncbi:MAG TPA: formate dehydrogenase-N subunit alpha [Acidobacteria bacterium]|nr:formate dehydrogenase-N subunit alpha [Acidobacteriota bacterium]